MYINLLADLGPLLSLFGERVTTQFLSEAMGWQDHMLVAMVPLGIITIIVSAIRVCGPRWLKAIVGRAKESIATTESEVMSSTSADVCEVWNGTQVVRAVGSAVMLEVFYTKHKGNGCDICLYGEFEESGNEKRFYGVYSFFEASEQASLSQCPKDYLDKPANRTPHPPNISLNAHGEAISTLESTVWAGIGICLQMGLLIFGGIMTFQQNSDVIFSGGSSTLVPLWSFYVTTVGTMILSIGLLLCSFLIDRSTDEVRCMMEKELQVAWFQKAHKAGGENVDSYAIFPHDKNMPSKNSTQPISSFGKVWKNVSGPFRKIFENAQVLLKSAEPLWNKLFSIFRSSPESGKRYIRSTHHAGVNTPNGHEYLATIATFLSLSGFVLQFSGMREMHWTLPIAQLLFTLLMLGIKVVVRRHLFGEPNAVKIPDHCDLGAFAKRITGCDTWRIEWDSDGQELGNNADHTLGHCVFYVRKRLVELSSPTWQTELHDTAVRLQRTIQETMKFIHESDLFQTDNAKMFKWEVMVR
ncbi:hypothetical protein RUND412_007753 [Rhizina undulata]